MDELVALASFTDSAPVAEVIGQLALLPPNTLLSLRHLGDVTTRAHYRVHAAVRAGVLRPLSDLLPSGKPFGKAIYATTPGDLAYRSTVALLSLSYARWVDLTGQPVSGPTRFIGGRDRDTGEQLTKELLTWHLTKPTPTPINDLEARYGASAKTLVVAARALGLPVRHRGQRRDTYEALRHQLAHELAQSQRSRK